MPQTDVALGLREAHLHPEFFGEGWYTHATGFAIDWRAYVAPHITDPSLIALFETAFYQFAPESMMERGMWDWRARAITGTKASLSVGASSIPST